MSISDEAAEWFIRLHAGDLTIAERYEFLLWLKKSPVHIAEFLRVCRLHVWLGAVQLQPAVANEDSYSNVVRLASGERTAPPRTARPMSMWRARIAAAAAVLGLAVVIGLAASGGWFDASIATQASEWRSTTLPDGSTVNVGPHTQLRADFDEKRRVVYMSRGEAIFHVAKDPSRPFEVDADVLIVRATGTEFLVDRRGDAVSVTVAEGSVDVLHRTEAGGSAKIGLYAGDQTTVSKSGRGPVEQVDVDKVLAWKYRRFVFEQESLIYAADEFNRRNRVQIVVHPARETVAVNGGFSADDPQAFANAIAQISKSSVVQEGRDVLRIEPRAEPQ